MTASSTEDSKLRLSAKNIAMPQVKQGKTDTTDGKISNARPSTSASEHWPRSVMAPHLDVTDCTFSEVPAGTVAFMAITKYGVKDLTRANYQLRSWRLKFEGWPEEEYDPEEYDRHSDRRYRSRSRDRCSAEDEEADAKVTEDGSKFHSELELGLGVHETQHEGKRILVLVQEVGNSELHQCSMTHVPNRSMFLFAEGLGQGRLIQSFVEEMLKRVPLRIPPKPVPREFKIFRWSHRNGRWAQTQTQQARQMESVILPESMIERVEKDMTVFLSKKMADWYNKFGIPYKRSYLFHGVPGAGKTSLICALAGRFKRRVCFLNAHNPSFSDDSMKRAMEYLPNNSFLIMEDIDSLFNKRVSQSRHSALTFTGLLNTLDGIGHAKGQIVIMTTNYIDRLDDALIRAGRADVWVEFKKASDWQLEKLFKWFYHESDPEETAKWAVHFREECRKKFVDGVTMAEMQQHFVDHCTSDPETCAKGVENFDMPLRKLKEVDEQRKEEQEKEKTEKDSSRDGTPDFDPYSRERRNRRERNRRERSRRDDAPHTDSSSEDKRPTPKRASSLPLELEGKRPAPPAKCASDSKKATTTNATASTSIAHLLGLGGCFGGRAVI